MTLVERAERIHGNTYRFHARDAYKVHQALADKLCGVTLSPAQSYVDAGPLSMEEAGLLVQELNHA